MTVLPSDRSEPLSDEEIQDLLVKTSRTFALCIPMLPDSLRRAVGIAYLLYRIADTIEDGVELPAAEKIELLERFTRVLEEARSAGPCWMSGSDSFKEAIVFRTRRPTNCTNDLELFQRTPRVVATVASFAPDVRDTILSKVKTSATGMSGFIGSRGEPLNTASSGIELRSRRELAEYCYCVAGLVGEMLTELFLLGQTQLRSATDDLMVRASDFGEALQLVNILKDSHVDNQEGRRFIPRGVSRDALMGQARDKLAVAQQYVDCLCEHDADVGVIRFTQFPVSLASLTLDRLRLEGAGAKVSRSDVERVLAELAAIETGGSRRPLTIEGQKS